MKIRVFSDVHNEIRRYYEKNRYIPWEPMVMPEDKETVLILAGDIDHAKQLPSYIAMIAKRFKAVIHVAGNHEYYGSNVTSCSNHMAKINEIPNAYHLNNDCVTIEGQHFLGSTMWTDLTGREYVVMQSMNDYKQIRVGKNYRRLTAMDTTKYYKEAARYIDKNITKDSIVITHHQPLSPANMGQGNPHGGNTDPTDYAYYASLQDKIVEDWKPKAWIAGHTHHNHDVDFFGTRLITNCVGYFGEEDYNDKALYDM